MAGSPCQGRCGREPRYFAGGRWCCAGCYRGMGHTPFCDKRQPDLTEDQALEATMERDQAAYLERIKTGDLKAVVGCLREWSAVESVPAQDEFDAILARLEAMAAAVTDLLGDPMRQGVYHVPIAREVRQALAMPPVVWEVRS